MDTGHGGRRAIVGIWVGESWDIDGGTRKAEEKIVDWRGISGVSTDSVEGGVQDRLRSDSWDCWWDFGCLDCVALEVVSSDILGRSDISSACFLSGRGAEGVDSMVVALLSPSKAASRLKTEWVSCVSWFFDFTASFLATLSLTLSSRTAVDSIDDRGFESMDPWASTLFVSAAETPTALVAVAFGFSVTS